MFWCILLMLWLGKSECWRKVSNNLIRFQSIQPHIARRKPGTLSQEMFSITFRCTYVHNIFVHVKSMFDAQLWKTKLLQCTANKLSIQVVRWRSNLPPWRVFRVCWQQHLLKREPHLYARSTVNATVEWMLCSEQSPTTLLALYIQENSCVDQCISKWMQIAGLVDQEK